MLPNLFSALLFRDLKGRVNAQNSILLHARQNMAVEIERDPNLAMAQPLARHFRVHSGRQHGRRVGVPKIVKSNSREVCGCRSPHLREATRLNGRAVLSRINEGGASLPHTEPQKLLGLIQAMLAQRQSALDWASLSASKRNPFERRVRPVALAPARAYIDAARRLTGEMIAMTVPVERKRFMDRLLRRRAA